MLCWVLLSSYHLIDFVLMFTPFYGHAAAFSDVPMLMWCDIGKATSTLLNLLIRTSFLSAFSILGFFYVVYFYKKLLKVDLGAAQRERLTEVDKLKLTGVDLEAY